MSVLAMMAMSSEREAPALSPARQRLADHQDQARIARQRVVDARTPASRLEDSQERAQAHVRACAADLDAVAALEAQDLEQWARTGDGQQPAAGRAKERTLASRALQEAQRGLGTVDSALGSARATLNATMDEAAEIERRTIELIIGVMLEHYEGAVARMVAARKAAVDAEATAVGFAHSLQLRAEQARREGIAGDRLAAMFHSATAAINAFQSASAPVCDVAMVDASAKRWSDFAAALASDPTAMLDGSGT